MSYIAPAGTRLTLRDIGGGLASGWMRRETEAELGIALCGLSRSKAAWPVVSGRAAMTLALCAIARHAGAGRDRVIVPAYTCYSVPAAVERAGLVPVPCDVDPGNLSLDLEHLRELATDSTAAVITANLFGLPNDLAEIERLARSRGIVLFDDAAQAMGARLAGRPVGGFGDLGLYSFDKGKNISTIQGGALLVRDGPLFRQLEDEYRGLGRSRPAETLVTSAKLAPYSLFLRPGAYALVRRLPLLHLGETRYETGYPVTRLSRGLGGLALRQLERLQDFRAIRLAHADALRDALDGIAELRFIDPIETAEPAFPRFPVRAASRALRDRLVEALNRAGIGASSFYPRALVDVPEVARRMPPSSRSFAGARAIADTILTLPTHAYCPPGLATTVRNVILRSKDA